MPTLLSSLETQARRKLQEISPSFWSSQELIDDCNKGIKDLWRAIIDLFQEHFLTINTTTVHITASTGQLSGVPDDVFRIHLIEPKIISQFGDYRNLIFVPRDYNSSDFIAARARGDVDSTQANVIYYCVTQAGAPIGAPVVLIAPTCSSAIAAGNLRLAYVPIVPDKTATDTNPIPGESDDALISWIISHAMSKDREDRSPDPNWLAKYGTEKQSILTAMTPRQTQEPDVVEPLFGGWW